MAATQQKAFVAIAERTRQRVEQLVASTAGDAGPLGEGEIKALIWAQLSGVVTAAANGFAGLIRAGAPDGVSRATMQQALKDQFDDAIEQALRMRSVAND